MYVRQEIRGDTGLYEHVNKPRWCVEMAYGGREDRIRLRRGFFCSFGQRPGFLGAIFQEILSISGRDIGVWVAPKNRVLKFKMAPLKVVEQSHSSV